MKFVIAPDSFKECMSAKDVCISIENGIKKVFKDAKIVKVPMADGGEGTVESMVSSMNGEYKEVEVLNGVCKKIVAKYGIIRSERLAIIEMASASGLELLKNEERNPMKTTTYGVGQLIEDALNEDVDRILVGIGGSATNDCGVGMAAALGAEFFDENGEKIFIGGEVLSKIKDINLNNINKKILEKEIIVLCDVKNHLYGREGAAYVFSKQKGANFEMIEELDRGMIAFSEMVKNKLNIDNSKVEGAGAAGGLGYGFITFLGAKLKPGVESVIKECKLEEKIQGADIVFTGEGSMDFQSKFGKTPIGVSRLSKKYNIKTIAICGKLEYDIEDLYEEGITAAFSILNKTETLEEAIKNSKKNIEFTVENICRLLKK